MNTIMTRDEVDAMFKDAWNYAYGLASWEFAQQHDQASRLFRVPEWDHAEDISMPGLGDPFFIGVK